MHSERVGIARGIADSSITFVTACEKNIISVYIACHDRPVVELSLVLTDHKTFMTHGAHIFQITLGLSLMLTDHNTFITSAGERLTTKRCERLKANGVNGGAVAFRSLIGAASFQIVI